MRAVFILGLVGAFALVSGHEHEHETKSVVDTHYGKVQGNTDLSRDGRMYYQFKGIPYAKAPERFQVPEIPDNFDGIRDATKFGPKCVQYDPKTKEVLGEEDCLTLNVFTPKLPKEGESTVLKPVVVVLHPGKHNHNSGSLLSPKYFMDEEVVVVTLNYRLGVFGFLNVGDKYSQGNMGIKDQTLALRWIMYNIEKFGGDKDRVTLLGSSAGATEAVIHTLAPQSKGLIHNVVVQSDNPLTPCALVKDPIAQAKKLGEQVGCPIDNSQNLIMCLKGMKATDILKKMKMPEHKLEELLQEKEFAIFGPSIEKILEGQTEKDVVLSDIPIKLLFSGKVSNKVPTMIGTTKYDGLTPFTAVIINSTENLKTLNDKWSEYAPIMFNYLKTSKEPEVVSQKIREFYFRGKEINQETRDTLINIFTDRYFASTTRFASKHLTKHVPVYLYFFTHKAENHIMNYIGYDNLAMGAGHMDELQYLFPVKHDEKYVFPEITKDSTPNELTLSKGMVKLWSSFFENGKPTKTWGEGKEWKKVENPEKPLWYNIDLETKMMEEPEDFYKRMAFWGELYNTQLTPELETPPQEKF